MTREEIIRNLKYTMEKHKNDTVNTFGTNISAMCKDILDYLEQEPCEDCISRAEAIEQYTRWYAGFMSLYDNGNFQDVLKNLPSIQPKPKTDVLDKIRAEIQRLRGCSCSCSDGIIDDVEDILDKYKAERGK